MQNQPLILDLGCGNKKRQGTIGVDFNDRTAADVIHDLNVFPYPFEDASVDHVYLDNTLEHLDDVIKVMEEVYRIVKPGGSVKGALLSFSMGIYRSYAPTFFHCQLICFL